MNPLKNNIENDEENTWAIKKYLKMVFFLHFCSFILLFDWLTETTAGQTSR